MRGHTPRSLAVKFLSVREAPVAVLLAALVIYFALRTPGFLEPQGLLDIARQYSAYAILAVALTLVIGSAGIDISVGSVLGLSAVVLGVALTRGDASLGLACLLSLGTGTLFGLANGAAVAVMRLQPVVVTLSTMATARGLAYVIAGRGVSSISLPARAEPLQNAAYLSPAPVVVALVIAAVGSLVLTRSAFGRGLLATGSNEKAAGLSGINVQRTKLAAYTATGALAGLSGIMTAGLMSTATTDAGLGYEFEAITAVLMGGTSVTGGEATVMGSVLGVAAAAVINRGLGLMGVSDHWRMMCLGIILIVSVLLDRVRNRIAQSSAAGEGAV